ncbi:ABC transporter substrate-binding protein [Pararhizobium sp.]|uniref:ABC transporter substrate-binding protein n=1 Tax=Pararhizobium sp. TaxID=1977563 RepID=UPI00271D97A6|nr:ABC transporter substrate-binding protein [Pararhizobium sp.]MDO9416107.1 ABC transporter substrate-binding protein [Pararhizobium sp.]
MTNFMLTRRAALATTLGLAIAPSMLRAEERKTVTVALDWTPNTNHIGMYVARDKGFYREAGIEVEILPYSDTSAGTLVSNHIADFGVISALGLFTQKTAGADLVAAYAVVQTETGRLVFNDNRTEIQTPKDLDGLTYGGFGTDWEKNLIGSMIRHDGGKGEFEVVTLGTSVYEALANGAIDFTLEIYTWEGVKAERDGQKQRAFRYADYGAPDQHTTLLASSSQFLSKNPEAARAFVQATRRGFDFAVDHPDEATDLLVAANSDALTDRGFVRASLGALIDGHYFRTAKGVTGSMDPAKMQALADYLFTAEILKDDTGTLITAKPDAAGYYINDLLGGS